MLKKIHNCCILIPLETDSDGYLHVGSLLGSAQGFNTRGGVKEEELSRRKAGPSYLGMD